MSDNDKEAGKRKRRRRGGLRVPSDNVPRAKSQSEVAAPAPEDPRLAVSVAYAFGSNGAAATAQLEDESAVRDTIRNPPIAAVDEDERRPEESTIELDSVDELIEDDLDDVTEAAAQRPLPPEDSDELDAELADELADAGQTRDLALDDETVIEPPIESDSARHVVRVRGDSVDIAFDEDDNSADETAPSAESPPLGSSADGADDPPPRPARSGGARFLRAQTMALSDHDLEELMEGEVMDSDAAFGFDHRKTVRMSPLDLPVPEPESDSEQEPELEHIDEAAPVAPHDAGDSGEIIADDMLEEIDELARPVEPIAIGAPEASAEILAVEDEAPPEPPPPPVVKAKPKPPPAPAIAEPPPPRRAKGKAIKPWFEEVFDENYLRTLPFLTPQATESEADFVVDSLDLEPGASILDVGCGYGRHSMELAARGFNMVGLDLSLPLLLRGADEAQRRGLDINFVHGDMREMEFEAPFDGAFCLFATFGYFDDETNKQAAQQIARALKPGARLVLEVLNRDYLIRDLPTRVWWEGDGCVILEEVDFNYFASRIVSRRSIAFEDGRQLEQEISIRAFALHELGKLLHAAGFRVLEISGSMFTRGRFFGGQSRDIVVVAEKRGQGAQGTKNGAS